LCGNLWGRWAHCGKHRFHFCVGVFVRFFVLGVHWVHRVASVLLWFVGCFPVSFPSLLRQNLVNCLGGSVSHEETDAMTAIKSITVQTPAKVNLVLELLRKREDGFHDLKLVFQAIDLWDQITFEQRPEGVKFKVVESPSPLAEDDSNIVVKAAKKFIDEVLGGEGGVSITLRKRIPVAAGLGGGSSDAAATLLGLDHLFQTGVFPEELDAMAAEMGSDINFFLKGGTALGTGRGEIIQPWPEAPSLDLVLVKPDAGLSTADVYRSGLGEFSPGRLADAMQGILQSGDKVKIGRSLYNGLERAAFNLQAACFDIKMEFIQAGALGSIVSGSGPTVFGLAASVDQARTLAQKLTKKGRKVFVAKTIPGGVKFV
jgi:4-diphosphocytidyl-2-C-methyl-D-erythritol kinase